MLFYVLLLIFTGFLTYIHVSARYSRKARILNKMPGPRPLPFVGNLFLFKDLSQTGMWITIRKLTKMYNPVFMGWCANTPIVSISHPDDFEVVLSSQKAIHKNYPYTFLRSWLHDGLLTNKGDTYRIRRKMLTPVFHFNMLRGYMGIMNEQADRVLGELRAKGKEFVIDILPIYTDVSLNTIIECAMGVDIDKADKNIVREYKEALEDAGYYLVYRMMRPYLTDWMINYFTKAGSKHKHTLKVLHEFTDKIIKERREHHEKSEKKLPGYKQFTENLDNPENDNMYTMEYKKKLPMLDLLLSAEKDGMIDDQGIRAEVDTFLLGGTDTTRMTMAYFTMLIAENKNAQDKARAEICAVFETSGGKTGMAELQQMPYLEMCIKESMRIFPIGSTIFRHTTDDIQLKNYLIPADVIVVCHLIDAHRDPNFWPEPEKYDPDRFLPENCRRRHPFAYLPMSAGPRNCIGQKFGMLEMKAICSRLLYNFYLEPIDYTRDMTLIGDFVLRPADPFHTKFIRIDRE